MEEKNEFLGELGLILLGLILLVIIIPILIAGGVAFLIGATGLAYYGLTIIFALIIWGVLGLYYFW